MPSIRHVGRTPQALSGGNVCLGFNSMRRWAAWSLRRASRRFRSSSSSTCWPSGRPRGHVAAAAGLIGALIVAVAVWNMPVSLAISSTLNGAAFGLFPIVWIVITAVWVYNMTVESGEFEIIRIRWPGSPMTAGFRRCSSPMPSAASSKGRRASARRSPLPPPCWWGRLHPLWGAGIALIANYRSCRFRRHRRAAHRGGLRVRP